jgi:hypothetical protein
VLVRDGIVDVHVDDAGLRQQIGHIAMQCHRFIPSRGAGFHIAGIVLRSAR